MVAGAVVTGLPAGAGGQTTPRCTASALSGAIIDEDGGAGSRGARLLLVNTSPRTCHTRGFIGGQLIDTNERPLPTKISRAQQASRTIGIKSGAAGAVTLQWNVIPSGNRPCVTARWLRVTPPDGTTSIRVYFGDRACRGEITVGPVTDPRGVA